MINRTNVIMALAVSEMVRGPLSNWEKFKLPEPSRKVDALLEQLRDAEGSEPKPQPSPRS